MSLYTCINLQNVCTESSISMLFLGHDIIHLSSDSNKSLLSSKYRIVYHAHGPQRQAWLLPCHPQDIFCFSWRVPIHSQSRTPFFVGSASRYFWFGVPRAPLRDQDCCSVTGVLLGSSQRIRPRFISQARALFSRPLPRFYPGIWWA